jgi:cell division protein FtsB
MAGYAIFAVSFVLVVNALVGENGYLATAQARREAAEIAAQIQQVQSENQRLKDEIRRLKVDPAALEEAARRDLRLGKPGETMIIIKDGTKPRAGTPK